jgi:hypothetical protein
MNSMPAKLRRSERAPSLPCWKSPGKRALLEMTMRLVPSGSTMLMRPTVISSKDS